MTLARFALIAALGCGSTAWAQTTGTTGTGNSGPAGASTTPNSGFQGSTMESAPTISGGATSGASVNSSNVFASHYANPYYQGRPGSTGTDAPGGFGAALSGGTGTAGRTSATTSRTTGTSGTAARTTSGASTTGTAARTSTGSGITGTSAGAGFGSGFGTTGTTGTRTGTTGFGTTGTNRGTGTGFSSSGSQQQGVLATQTRPVAVSVVARFPVKPVLPAATTSEITSALARSSYLSNAGSIQVNHDGGRLVTLRGQVKDAEEAQAAEGIARLTPGVRAVKNELTYPKP